MMAIGTLGFSALISTMAAAVQSGSSALVTLSPGSVLRSLLEAVASVMLWLQGMVLQVLAASRAATCTGSDLDSWLADYGFSRLPGVAATGSVTFSRLTAGAEQIVIPVGASLRTGDGSQSFTVIADSSSPVWSASANGYILAGGALSVMATIQAQTSGVAGNVSAGTITVMTSAITGIDMVINPFALTSGQDAESDSAARSRFVDWINSLSKATEGAIAAAINGVQSGLSFSLTENADYSGNALPGYFYVVVDDGSGAPSPALLASVAAAVEAVRPLGVRYGVFAPQVIYASPSMCITTAAGYSHAAVVAAVSAALTTAINALPLGQGLPLTKLAATAYGVSGVTNVTGLMLNGGSADLGISARQVIKCQSVTVA